MTQHNFLTGIRQYWNKTVWWELRCASVFYHSLLHHLTSNLLLPLLNCRCLFLNIRFCYSITFLLKQSVLYFRGVAIVIKFTNMLNTKCFLTPMPPYPIEITLNLPFRITKDLPDLELDGFLDEP